MNFVSLNSWNDPRFLYQGENPVEIVRGGPRDWDQLRERLRAYQSIGCDTPHPTGAAVGYIEYDGSYWFGIYPELHCVPKDGENARWRNQRQAADRTAVGAGSWESNLTANQFEQMVGRAQDYIRSGDIYQVNLAQRFSCDFSGNPYGLFEQLSWRSPAPGAAFIDTGDLQVLCSSPELFLHIQGRQVQTRPIKGTRPRSRDPLRDRQLAYELMTDPKEQAELIMITDLERNDLGQICEYGSVTVTDLLRLERYAQVYHLVSTVEGSLASGVDLVSAIAACFPGGSITGAPKKRAREIIQELEPEPRGLYTGALGYLGFNGDAALSMVIRTMIVEQGRLHFHVGSGITADSVGSAEYAETLAKAEGMRIALEQYLGGAQGNWGRRRRARGERRGARG